MTSREAFEAWHIEHVSRKPRLDAPKGLFDDDKKAWAAWREAERQALERALEAVSAEHLQDDTESPEDHAYQCAVDDCEHAVRALIGDASKEGS